MARRIRSQSTHVGRTVRRLILLAAGAVAVASVLGAADGAASRAQATTLRATVGPSASISLVTAQGTRVTQLDPGAYRIEVSDLSEFHSFRLRGPGVERSTTIEGTGTETWNVTLAEGTYTFLCDAHPATMRGIFVVGNPVSTPPPSNVVPAGTRVMLTSGPSQVIRLRTGAGKRVTRMKVGAYRVVVRDRSREHNARVVAPGFRRATTVRFVGSQVWRVRLRRPGTLRFLCDPHASLGMRGSARIVR